MRRLIIDGYRKASNRQETVTDDVDAVLVDCPCGHLETKQLARAMRAVLSELPRNQREAFELVRADGLSCAEAAEVLGTTENAIKLRVHRACDAMREAMRKDAA